MDLPNKAHSVLDIIFVYKRRHFGDIEIRSIV